MYIEKGGFVWDQMINLNFPSNTIYPKKNLKASKKYKNK
jgi:hypothetical protein